MAVATEWIARSTTHRMAGDRRSRGSHSKPIWLWNNHNSRTDSTLSLAVRLNFLLLPKESDADWKFLASGSAKVGGKPSGVSPAAQTSIPKIPLRCLECIAADADYPSQSLSSAHLLCAFIDAGFAEPHEVRLCVGFRMAADHAKARGEAERSSSVDLAWSPKGHLPSDLTRPHSRRINSVWLAKGVAFGRWCW